MTKRPTVLVVDDEPAVTDGLRRALRSEPYDIVCSNSGADALRTLSSRDVDVVVSDEQMPGMTGSELLATVCRRHPDTVRIILTGHANLDAIIRSINEGEIYRFLSKPCNPEELAFTIRQALEQRQLRIVSRRVLKTLKQQALHLRRLEQSHPGITRVERDASGAIVVEDMAGELDRLSAELQQELGDIGGARS